MGCPVLSQHLDLQFPKLLLMLLLLLRLLPLPKKLQSLLLNNRLVKRLKLELELLKLPELLRPLELLLNRGLLQSLQPDKGLLLNKLQEKELLLPLLPKLLLNPQQGLFTTLSTRLLIMKPKPTSPSLRPEMEKPLLEHTAMSTLLGP